MEIVVLRLGHRLERDKRVTTHVGLVGRALGARGMLLAAKGRHHDAVKSFDHALENRPAVHLLYQKGLSLSQMGRYEMAIQCFDELLAAEEHNPGAWYAKGVALNSLGRFKEAAQSYMRAVDLGYI